jgi:hypothetical protein
MVTLFYSNKKLKNFIDYYEAEAHARFIYWNCCGAPYPKIGLPKGYWILLKKEEC